MPALGVARRFENPRLEGLRMFSVLGFRRHLVFYRPTAAGVEVVRVLHGARDISSILAAEP